MLFLHIGQVYGHGNLVLGQEYDATAQILENGPPTDQLTTLQLAGVGVGDTRTSAPTTQSVLSLLVSYTAHCILIVLIFTSLFLRSVRAHACSVFETDDILS